MSRVSRIAHVMVGLPGSGKSSWSRGYAWPVVNLDAIRTELFGERFNEAHEDFVFARAAEMANVLLAVHHTIVIDDVNHTIERREYWRRHVKADRFIFMNCSTSLEDCIERDAKREHPVGRAVIEAMAAEAQEVQEFEEEPFRKAGGLF